MNPGKLVCRIGAGADDYHQAAALFTKGGSQLCQDSDAYTPPQGALLFADVAGSSLVGCAAIQRIDDHAAQVMMVFPRIGFWGYDIATPLLGCVITFAREAGYKSLRSDYLENIKQDGALYADLGFRLMPLPKTQPLRQALWMEKQL